MLGLSARSGALAAGLGLVAAFVSPLGPIAQAAPAPTSSAAHAGFVVLKQGSNNTHVVALEKRIGIRPANRYFGADTRKRVQVLQKWGGIPRTGVVDYRTAQVINRYVHLVAVKKAAQKRAAAKSLHRELSRIITMARKYKGRPYVYGAAGPRAFDCSGFTRYVVRKAIGRSLPHQSGGQAGVVRRVSRANARPGDLIFFRHGGHVYHVGIYAGGNKLWHASHPGARSGLGTIFSSNVTFGRVA